MSYYEYLAAKKLRELDPPYYALLMAAMWGADSYNAATLRDAWPDVWDELQARYDAPGGLLEGESQPDSEEQG